MKGEKSVSKDEIFRSLRALEQLTTDNDLFALYQHFDRANADMEWRDEYIRQNALRDLGNRQDFGDVAHFTEPANGQE